MMMMMMMMMMLNLLLLLMLFKYTNYRGKRELSDGISGRNGVYCCTQNK